MKPMKSYYIEIELDEEHAKIADTLEAPIKIPGNRLIDQIVKNRARREMLKGFDKMEAALKQDQEA